MKAIMLKQHTKTTYEGCVTWWAYNDQTGYEFTEIISEAAFKIPDRWNHVFVNGRNDNILRHDVEFQDENGNEGYLDTNAAGQPVIVDEWTGAHTILERM